MADKEEDYEVGYGKPPRHSRWPKGVSGNVRGRETGHKGLKTDLEKALNTVTTIENKLTGELVKGRNQKLAIERLVDRAALGDLKAQALLYPMILQILGSEDRHTGPRKLSTQDQEILAEVLASRMAEFAGEPQPANSGCKSLPPPPDMPWIEGGPDNEEGSDGEAN